MAEEIASTEPTTDEQLEALLSTSKPAAPAVVASKPGDPPPEVVASPSKEGEENPLLKALDEISDGEEETPAPEGKGALTADQQEILKVIPDIQTASNLYGVVENYNNFTQALQAGKFDDVEEMLSSWDKNVIDGWLEHIYEKKVASGEWVDRFIAEKEGRGPENKGLTKLQNEMKELREQLAEKKNVNTKAEQEQATNQAFVNYNKYINSLFDQMDFSKADRRWVAVDLNSQVAANPKVVAALKAGNLSAVNKLFKTACRDYIERDKVVVAEKDAKIEVQSKKKLPLGGGGGEAEGALSDDIREVPKDKVEVWVDRQLGKLFSKKK